VRRRIPGTYILSAAVRLNVNHKAISTSLVVLLLSTSSISRWAVSWVASRVRDADGAELQCIRGMTCSCE
jgi:hypothetical protein